ncbi:hypothetical protein [Algoriphagus sediminis]|uniref:Uncharacterized protein n=1 Tax=Algoriphagus sediminis TaxID=3057113 RepID=A0ABT7YH11_9BACT|nr:hypothetical protein [Algoriphagus sediminis]MDN3205809.1 hypothetical protein [Algoriphagus sediminis]
MKKLYSLIALAVLAVTATACFDDPGTEVFFEGNLVEWADGRLPNGTQFTGVRASEDQTDVFELEVNRVSTDGNGAITVNVEVDPSSTAVEGVHYNLSATSTTINGGDWVANFPVTILTGNIDPSETPDLVLNITSATGAEVSSNYGSVTLRIRVVCPSEISTAADTWSGTTVSRFGTDVATVTVTPLETAGQYVVSDMSTGLYPRFGFSTTQELIIADNCNVISYVAPRQTNFNIVPPTGEATPTEGSWDEATGTLTFYWRDEGNNIDAVTTLVKN